MTNTAETLKGCIFDIRRFSVHDGSGIRTVVFFKGCPLRCRWCQNPEGLEDFIKPVWLSGACINCGRCNGTVPAAEIEANKAMDACPAKAWVWNGKKMTVDEVFVELEKDKVFFAHNGGCTLSGGEPLAQGDFAIALLERIQQEGIHTAIETSLYATQALVEKAAERSDQIFADCKIIDPARHAEATGKTNEIILNNLDHLLSGKHAHKTIVRIPLIPGFTGDNENVIAIADFIRARNPKTPVELLNYNPLAASKYPYDDLQGNEIAHCKPYSTEQMTRFRTLVRERGITCTESV